MKYKHVTLLFIGILLLFCTLLVPTSRSSVNKDYMFSVNHDVEQFENSSFVLQPLWSLGQKSERIPAIGEDGEPKAEITTINRTTTTYLWQVHLMLILVFVLMYSIISHAFYIQKNKNLNSYYHFMKSQGYDEHAHALMTQKHE